MSPRDMPRWPSSTVQWSATEIAALRMEEVLGEAGAGKRVAKIGGALVQPAVWATTEDAPDAVDVGVWVAGLFAGPAGWAALMTGAFKALLDGHTAERLAHVRASEPKHLRPGILPVTKFSTLTGDTNTALRIAMKGGVAWEHPNGLWVFLRDAKGGLVPDHDPALMRRKVGPKLPMEPAPGGGFRIEYLSRRR